MRQVGDQIGVNPHLDQAGMRRQNINQLYAHRFHIQTRVVPAQVEQNVQSVGVEEPLCELDRGRTFLLRLLRVQKQNFEQFQDLDLETRVRFQR